MFDIHVYHHFPQDHDPGGLLHTIIQQGERIMAAIDDLRAKMLEANTNLTALGVNVGEINTGVVNLDAQVKALIALIGQNPDVPQDVVDAANLLAQNSAALVAQTQSVEDSIAQIPPSPAQG